MADDALPWVLLRRGRPPARFATREAAMAFFDALRFNGKWRDEEAALRGPGRDWWKCRHSRAAIWLRDYGAPDDEDAA